jgi:hypothetical protein
MACILLTCHMYFRNQSNGQAVLRLLQFAEQLNPGGDQVRDEK